MADFYCYKCREYLSKEDLNENKDAFVCPKCQAVTVLEKGDYKKLGLTFPSEKTSPVS